MLKKIITMSLSLVLMFSVATMCFVSANAEANDPTEAGNRYEVSIDPVDSSLVLRSDASQTGISLARIPNGSVICITEIVGDYGKAIYGNLQGWVSMEYLCPTDKEVTEPVLQTESYAKFIVTLSDGESLAIYSKGNDEGSVIGYIPNGTELYISELSGNGKFGNTVFNGQYGWVPMEQLTQVSGDKLYVDTDNEIIGDATMDGSLDMLDVTVTQKFIAELDADCNTELADMDKSGRVDLQDVVQMQKTIADII